MKITQIDVQNFQGLRSATLSLGAPVALVAGLNGAGKSSLRDAIAMALSGKATRVALKKDYGSLVAEGQKTGAIRVELADGRYSTTALPEGKTTFFGKAIEAQDKARAALAYVIEPALFAKATADERRAVLFTLTGCSTSAEEVQKRLAARGADADKVEAVLPLLRADFPTAEKEARTRATEAKGAWRAVTGEAYGDKKAASFAVEKTEVAEEELLQAEHDIDVVDGEIAAEQQHLGELLATYKAQQGRASQIAALEERAGRIDKIQRKLDIDAAELAEWDGKVETMKALATSTVRHGFEGACPCCGEELVLVSQTAGDYTVGCNYRPHLLRKSDAVGGDQNGQDEAIAKLPEYQQARDLCARAVENDRRDLAAANEAAAQLCALEQSGEAVVTEADLRAKEDRIALLRESRKQLAGDLEALRARHRAAADADRKTAEAASHHADVQGWLAIADALAPDGIPGELLAEALRPVNDLLFSNASLAGWARVQLSRDMEITADGRVYGLLSESEQWRADCLLAITLATLSGLKLVLLDRFDVLDLPSRKQLIGLIDDLAYEGVLDTAVLCGTLKAPPAGMPDTIEVFWVENGAVAPIARKQERVAA